MSACGACGNGLRDNANFCDDCGAPTAAVNRDANYKQVTVLFTDVVRSMAIATAVDMERMRDILTEVVARSAAVVARYGGSVENTGDGVMALFGAPVALEDHALRACLAALDIQHEMGLLAAEVHRQHGVELRVRAGLNSGRVIAGETGAGSLGYAVTGTTVGFAQRMESAAPAGGIMLSESTAQLVENTAIFSEPEWVHIKGSDAPVPARRLLAIVPRDGLVGRDQVSLVGRRWEMAALGAIVDRTIGGRGCVVNIVGPAGIGKSRVAREIAALAASRGAEVRWAFCESHARDVPFHLIAQLLRVVRDQLHAQSPDADPQDLLLLDDLLGLVEPGVAIPQIDPDARRRRLTALINTASLARSDPAVYIVEDAHWIDAVSESMLADFLTVLPQTRSMVLVTSRPEYEGALARVHGGQTIALAPLGDSDATALIDELLGPDPSVAPLTAIIADRAVGNPFFAEEMVRELVQRGVLTGERGSYICGADVSELTVPPTVQAAIEARIDRLTAAAKQTLNAAAVIGARFDADLLSALGIDPVLDELLTAELIDQVRFTPSAEYGFRHPLIRAVTYESQLKSDRSVWHRRLAAVIEERAPGTVHEKAALIAEHLESAGDLHAAFGWHMRAGEWATKRDVGAARLSWGRARRIADALPEDDPDHLSMRIAPRTMLCATIFHAAQKSRGAYAELRELCEAAGDKISLAIGMTGLATELLYSGCSSEGARLASEQMTLLESIGIPTLTVGLSFVAFVNWFDNGGLDEILRWTQIVIDMADGDPTMGAQFGMGSPLAAALALRGVTRWWVGRPGWQQDLHDSLAMAQNSDPATRSLLIAWSYGMGICCGVLRADDQTLREIEETVRIAAATSNDFGLGMAEYTLGVVLLHRDVAADRLRGLEFMAPAQDMWRERAPHLIQVTQLAGGREQVRRGDRDAPIPVMRKAINDLNEAGRRTFTLWATGVFVETLVERGTADDLDEAQETIDGLATAEAGRATAMRDITLLRLRTLLARARHDDVAFPDSARRYLALAKALGFEGHIAWAEAMVGQRVSG